jgi:hypothetical protein
MTLIDQALQLTYHRSLVTNVNCNEHFVLMKVLLDKYIRKELSIHNLNYIILDYKSKWTQHLLRMKDTHIFKLMYEYIPPGRKNVGLPRKKWTDQQP